MSVKQQTEQHLEFLGLIGGCPALFESVHVKMPHCWKSHVAAHVLIRMGKQRVTGAQWLSGRVLDSRPKGSGFEPHRRHYVVVLEQDTFILA